MFEKRKRSLCSPRRNDDRTNVRESQRITIRFEIDAEHHGRHRSYIRQQAEFSSSQQNRNFSLSTTITPALDLFEFLFQQQIFFSSLEKEIQRKFNDAKLFCLSRTLN